MSAGLGDVIEDRVQCSNHPGLHLCMAFIALVNCQIHMTHDLFYCTSQFSKFWKDCRSVTQLMAICMDPHPPMSVMVTGTYHDYEEFLQQVLPFPLEPSTHVVSNRTGQ